MAHYDCDHCGAGYWANCGCEEKLAKEKKMTIEQVSSITCVVRYKSSDGNLFETEEEAATWEHRDKAISELAKSILEESYLMSYRSDAHEMATWFVDNYNFERKPK